MAPRSTKHGGPARPRTWVPASLTALLLVGGYLTADVFDLAPGPLTLSEPWPDAEPFPTPTLPVATPEVALGLAEGAPTPAPGAVADLLEEFVNEPGAGPAPGILVVDAASGETLGEVNADDVKVPASTTKLLTAIAALDAAGATHRLTTQVVDGSVDDPEAVTIVGGGDLTLDPGEGDPNAIIGHGGVATLAAEVAAELKSAGRTAITDIVVDEGLWEGDRLAPRWDERDLNEGWIIPMSPLALDLGRIDGQMTRTDSPARDVADALREALEGDGIEVSGQVRTGAAGDSALVLGAVESAPLAELAEYMLVYSDNVLAESLGRLVAVHSALPASFEGTEEAITNRLTDLGVETDGLRLADASGLSSVNQISPRTLVDAMGAITQDHPDLLATVRGLPVAGLEGTLRNRMRESAGAGTVAAKTGSLRNAATIAGQVHTVDGRLLHVAIMTSDWEGSLAEARAGIDRLLTGLAACGCS